TDAFVTKMNQNGTGLVYSTFLGGTSSDYGYGIAVDGSGYAYVTGYTSSSNFPTTSGCWDNTYNSTDAFVTKMNQNGTGLVYSTFLGGTSSDYGYAIAVDANGCAFVTGYTSSSNFPTTAGAWDNIYNSTDAFVTKFNLTGSGLVYSTFLGGTSSEYGRGIALDDIGNAIVAGYTNSSNFPVTFDAFDNTANGGYDIFFTIFNSDGSFLDYSTYLGGASTDYGYYNSCLAYGGNNAIVTGYTSSSNFPTTVGAWDIIYNGGDVIVAKFDVGPPRTITIESVSAAQFCPGEDITVSFSITGIYLLGNVFTVQLSDQNGSFTKPIIIGTLSSVDAGTINCTIPIDIPSGMFYKIRIVSSKPAITSPDNGYDLTVMPFPSSYKIIGSGAYCEGDLKGAEIKLESSEAGTKYQVYLDGEKYGFPIVGTGKELSLGYYKTEGLYTIEGTTPFGCTRFLSSQINVKKVAIPEVYSMTGGSKVYNEAGDGTYCDGELGVAI
ncbi:MAG TPA: SBBP repeat-containing protein, partial [Candidatus Kapabacteria bacterium]|nr:SBBP repeat-containing protein [Candidatus Kapabacteria bacterium]